MLLHDMLNEEHDEDKKKCRSTKLPQEQSDPPMGSAAKTRWLNWMIVLRPDRDYIEYMRGSRGKP